MEYMDKVSKINIADTVSNWITALNNIVDTIKLAVAPSQYDKNGKPIDGNNGYMSKEDKKIIDELSITYMPIKGALSPDATWYKNIIPTSKTAFDLTIESDNFILYNQNKTVSISIVPATINESGVKYLCFLNETGSYILNLTYNGSKKEFVISKENKPLILRVLFIGGQIVVTEEIL